MSVILTSLKVNTGTITGLKLVKTQPMSREKLWNSFRKSGEQLLKNTLKNLHESLASCLHIEKWLRSWDFCTVVYLLFKSSVCKNKVGLKGRMTLKRCDLKWHKDSGKESNGSPWNLHHNITYNSYVQLSWWVNFICKIPNFFLC